MTRHDTTSRPEAAFVMLLMQSLFWLVAAISAVPFAIAGEIFMAALSLVTLLLALATFLTGLGVLWRRPAARRAAIALEVLCLAGTALLILVPIGFNKGLVSIMVNAALPIAVIVLLRREHQAANAVPVEAGVRPTRVP